MGTIKSVGPAEAEMSLAALSCRCATAASKSFCGHGHTRPQIPEFLSFWGLSSFPTLTLPTNSLVPVQTPDLRTMCYTSKQFF